MRFFIRTLPTIIAALIVIGCFPKSASTVGAVKQLQAVIVGDDLKIISIETARAQFGGKELRGVLKNSSERTYAYVSIEINLYDKDGAQVGTTLAVTQNLEGGGTWKWTAPILEQNADTYKVIGVTGF